MRSRKGTRSITAPPTLLLIPSTPSATSSTTTPTSTENIRVYLVIAVSLSKIKDKLTFIRRSITILIYNAGLLDIELK